MNSKLDGLRYDLRAAVLEEIGERSRAAEGRLRSYLPKSDPEAEDALAGSLASELGRIASAGIMEAFNRKITAPLVGMGVGTAVDSIVGSYMEKQRALLYEYSSKLKESKENFVPAISAGDSIDEEEKYQKPKPKKKVPPQIKDEPKKLEAQKLGKKDREEPKTPAETKKPETGGFYANLERAFKNIEEKNPKKAEELRSMLTKEGWERFERNLVDKIEKQRTPGVTSKGFKELFGVSSAYGAPVGITVVAATAETIETALLAMGMSAFAKTLELFSGNPLGFGGLYGMKTDLDLKYNGSDIETFPTPRQPKSILLDDRDRYVEWDKLIGFSGTILKNRASSVVKAKDENGDDFGICKKPNPYFPDDPAIKEDWMSKKKLTGKYEDMILGIGLYGLNPGNVKPDKGILKIDTELPGGGLAAMECYKNLTGFYPESIEQYFIKPDGTVIGYRALSKSGHPKVEINSKTTNKVHEKITFK